MSIEKAKRMVREYLERKYGKGTVRYGRIYQIGNCIYIDAYYYYKSIAYHEFRICDGKLEKL